MIPELENHLWQSTLFACAAGLLTLMLRRNRAAMRHGLWLAASVKFLIPFSLLAGLGSQIEWRKSPPVSQPRLDVVEQISEPLAILASPARLLDQRPSSWFPEVLFSLWLCGFTVNGLAWWRRWRQVHAAWRAASPLPLNLPMEARLTDAYLEPGVFGVFRPVLLLPEGLSEHLSATQFEAVIAHEVCHVRRRDDVRDPHGGGGFVLVPSHGVVDSGAADRRTRTCLR